MRKCAVNGCDNDNKKGFSLFRLPGVEMLREKWLEFLINSGAKNLENRKAFLICEEHFQKDQIVQKGKKRRKI